MASASIPSGSRLGERVVRALSVAHETESRLAEGSDPATIGALVARGLGELLLADLVVVASAAESTAAHRLVASVRSTGTDQAADLPELELVASQVRRLADGTILQIDLTSTEHGLPVEVQRRLRAAGVARATIMPLRRQGQWLGRIDLWHRQPGSIGSVELHLAEQLASQMASTLGLARPPANADSSDSAPLILHVAETLLQVSPGNPEALWQAVVGLLPGVIGCDRCYAFTWQSEQKHFRLTAAGGVSNEQISLLARQPLTPRSAPLLERMLYAIQPVAVTSQQSSRLLPAALVQELSIQAVLALPVRDRQRQLSAVIMLDHQQAGPTFSAEQVLLASRLCDQVAGLVEQAMLYDAVRRQSQRLLVLNEIGLELAALVDLRAVLPALQERLATILDVDLLLCAHAGPGDSPLTLYSQTSAAVVTVTEVEAATSPLLSEVYSAARTVQRETSAGSTLLTGLRSDTLPIPLESVIAVPLRVRNQRTVGMLAAFSTRQAAYTDSDLALLSTLAAQVAVAVDNARIYEEMQAKGERRGQLLDRLMSAHELERKSIVDDIHDDSLQAMASSMYKIDLCLRLSEGQNRQRQLEELRSVRANLAANVDRLRSLIFEIRPSTLDYLGLLPTLDDYLTRLERETGIQASFRSELGERLESGMETLIYRLLQELLTNVRKHSRASEVAIALRRQGLTVEIVVEDNGVGFDPIMLEDLSSSRKGLGLAAASEQVQVSGGSFNLESRPGAGTRVHVILPTTAGRHITGPLDQSRVARDST